MLNIKKILDNYKPINKKNMTILSIISMKIVGYFGNV